MTDRVTDIGAPKLRCIKLIDWPGIDQDAWAAAHRLGSLLEDDGLAASWARATSGLITRGYGSFLAFLAETDNLDPTESPATRVTRARVEAYIGYLRRRNHSSTVAARIPSAWSRCCGDGPDGGYCLATTDLRSPAARSIACA
jgi:hypothetical protein